MNFDSITSRFSGNGAALTPHPENRTRGSGGNRAYFNLETARKVLSSLPYLTQLFYFVLFAAVVQWNTDGKKSGLFSMIKCYNCLIKKIWEVTRYSLRIPQSFYLLLFSTIKLLFTPFFYFQKTLAHRRCCICVVKTVTWPFIRRWCHQSWWVPLLLTCRIYWEWSHDRGAGLYRICTYWLLHSLSSRNGSRLLSLCWMRLRREMTVVTIRYCNLFYNAFLCINIQPLGHFDYQSDAWYSLTNKTCFIWMVFTRRRFDEKA